MNIVTYADVFKVKNDLKILILIIKTNSARFSEKKHLVVRNPSVGLQHFAMRDIIIIIILLMIIKTILTTIRIFYAYLYVPNTC